MDSVLKRRLPPVRSRGSRALVAAFATVAAWIAGVGPVAAQAAPRETPAVIGATAWIEEATSGVRLLARVDTGAQSCSIHAERVTVVGGKKDMRKNPGKPIRFQITDARGEPHTVESTIKDTVIVKTSEAQERRYKVWVSLRHGGVTKRVAVTLNDRSHMAYPLLVGRNFLRGSFVVDVARTAPKTPPD